MSGSSFLLLPGDTRWTDERAQTEKGGDAI